MPARKMAAYRAWIRRVQSWRSRAVLVGADDRLDRRPVARAGADPEAAGPGVPSFSAGLGSADLSPIPLLIGT
jgi:hypothetical protein